MTVNKTNLPVLAALCGLLFLPARVYAATAEDSKIFTPYFNMSLAESLYVPSEGDFFSGGMINTQVGLLSKVAKNHNIFGLYNFKYLGPAFQPQDGKQFTERSLDHSFSFEYRWQLSERLRLRPAYAKTTGYRRNGVNEAWDNGLYNMNSQGGQVAVDYLFGLLGKNGTLTAQYLSRSLEFPNYTDLLREFQQAGSASELSGGLQNQRLRQWALRAYWSNFTAGASISTMKYQNQTVVENSGEYVATKQEDKSSTLDFGFNHRLWIFEAAPNMSYTIFDSNQNFLRFKYFGAAWDASTLGNGDSDVTFIRNAYSFREFTFDLPLFINMGMNSKWAISGGWSVTHRVYRDRPPRDSDNNYQMGQKQDNTLTKFYAGFRKHMNEIADLSLTYTFIVASSNNKFEKYLPYNYTGQALGLAYNLTF